MRLCLADDERIPMISDVVRAWGWTQAPTSGAGQSVTATILLPPGVFVKAQAELARAAVYSYGNEPWSAYAFIRTYCYRQSPDQVLCVTEPNPDLAPSTIALFDGTKVTFEFRATGPLAYVYGVGTVYIYS
jgi:hypothetical protein